jgi:hypothetical protein
MSLDRPDTHIPELLEALASAFEQRAIPELREVVDAVLSDLPDQLENYPATAHPLGFVHVLLAKRNDRTRLRLHIWPSTPFCPQEPTWPVHRHAWNLTSVVVRGRIRDLRYLVSDNPAGAYRLFSTSYEGSNSLLTPSGGTVACEEERTAIWSAGETYGVDSDAFHASEALEPSMTIVESGPPSSRPALVVGERDAGAVSYSRRPLDRQDVVSILGDLRD